MLYAPLLKMRENWSSCSKRVPWKQDRKFGRVCQADFIVFPVLDVVQEVKENPPVLSNLWLCFGLESRLALETPISDCCVGCCTVEVFTLFILTWWSRWHPIIQSSPVFVITPDWVWTRSRAVATHRIYLHLNTLECITFAIGIVSMGCFFKYIVLEIRECWGMASQCPHQFAKLSP